MKGFNKIIAIALIIFLQLSCNDNSVNLIKNLPTPLPDDMALYASIDGNTTGIWVFNANTLKKIDSLDTTPGVPWDIILAPDNSTIYSVWGRSGNYRLYDINNGPLFIKNSINLLTGNSNVLENYSKDYLVAYGSSGFEIFDRSTLHMVKQDSSVGWVFPIISSRQKPKLYFGTYSRGLKGLNIYDLDSLKVIENIPISDSASMALMQSVDIAVSPDDRYAFYSVFNWRGLGGFNKFYVIDLVNKKVISNYDCGAFARLAITPDGHYVFISDPAGYLYNFQSTKKVLRYDVENKTMEIFLYPFYGSDRFAIAPDNRTLFISSIGLTLPDGRHANIVKVDAVSGDIIGTYTIPLDSLGHIGNQIKNISLGSYKK